MAYSSVMGSAMGAAELEKIMKQTCNRTVLGEMKNHYEAFNTQDEKGRWVGVLIFCATVEYTAIDGRCGYHAEPGTYFEVRVQAAKNQNSFGASQPTKGFKTAKERSDYIEKTVQQRRQAAYKKYPVAA